MKEHGELHSILEKECWVFGEEYGLHASDRSLDEVLRQHCRLLGREDLVPETVVREDGRRGRVDLMLSQAARRGRGERHHLIVELKRPSTILSMTEFGQINGYAQAVVKADRFRDTAVSWDFWLVGNGMDEGLRQLAHQHDRLPGCALSQPRFRIWVKTGGEIIEDCQERLRFYGDQLEYQSSTEHAMDYLVREHNHAVSDLVADGTIPAARRGDTEGATV